MAMIELTNEEKTGPEELLDLFSIDDVVFTVPKRPRVNIALQYLDNLRRMGPVIADMMLLEKLIGEKGYKALSEYEGLKPEHLEKITDTVVQLTLGAMENSSKKTSTTDDDSDPANDEDSDKAKSGGRGNGGGRGRSRSAG